MAKKTKYMTALSIWMIFLCIGFAIPSIIEGINIARNYQTFSTNNEELLPGSYTFINFDIPEASRVNLDVIAWNASGSYMSDKMPITLAIMTEDTFTDWVLDGSPEPTILNTTQFYHRAEITQNNLKLGYQQSYYFVFYNAETITLEIDADIEILPWGHIIAVSIVGFLFSVCFITFGIKILSAQHFNEVEEKLRRKGLLKDDDDEIKPVVKEIKAKKDEKGSTFCQSCGTPLTPKDGQYCPQCGASI